tara:strand:+ start:85 stop:489 length:405 start_codon:yes stop_codon:yes gene_type:complete
MLQRKNIKPGKIRLTSSLLVFLIIFFTNSYSYADTVEQFAEINILDKVSSKSSRVKIKIGEEFVFQNLSINILKCINSKFDDDPEVTAYMQVRDFGSKDKNKVFIFNGWTFASSPSIKPFDHPVYDIWLKKCFS